ncbi:hypothetical protein SELR_02740 [Selenomonas ruminantium subsp. lactilytica TAM6421]|uniref:YDG domain-containing protein n=2 Tax=Selenomonas ruminantium TaxID=971 RepID=I0GMJ5_SELRL|nr:hypothetical protein SELR_02740 [Selenomonas ruminantium subsp. lactilytica TAM6421]
MSFGDSVIDSPKTAYVGALAGKNAGTIRNVTSTVAVTGKTNDDVSLIDLSQASDGIRLYAGGLVGENSGKIRAAGTEGAVSTSLNADNIGAMGNPVFLGTGGIAGSNVADGSIAEAYHATGNISATITAGMMVDSNSNAAGIQVGGIAGANAGTLQDIYNTAPVSGNITASRMINMDQGSLYAGGIAGNNSGTLANAYSTETGSVAATASRRVELGNKNGGAITGSGSGTSTKAYSENLTAAATFAAWGDSISQDGQSRTAVWRIYDGKTTPLLTAFMTPLDLSGYSVTYDGNAYGLVPGYVNTNLLEGYTDALAAKHTDAGKYEYDTSGLYSTQQGYNIITPADNKAYVEIISKFVTLDIDFDTIKKEYDGTTNATITQTVFNLKGVNDADKDKVAVTTENPAATFDNPNVGTEHVITYTGFGLSGELAGNYQLKETLTGAGEITAKALTIGNVTKVYDGNTTAAITLDNLNGIVDADKTALSLGAGVTAAYDTKNAGTGKTVNYSGLTLGGDKAGNYSLAAEGSISNASITARDITATVADLSPKTYDGQTAVNNVTAILDNTVEGDAISATASGSYADKNAGTDKAVTYNSFTLSGADKDNYNLTTTSYTGKGSITARDITATVADLDAKTYDGQTAVNNIAATLNNTVEGDAISATASGSYADKNAGTDKEVTYNSFTLSGADKGNYNLTTTSYTGKGSITARDITATVADLDAKTYDGQTAVNNVTAILDNTVEGDAISATASGSYADKNAGTDKAVTYNSFTLSGADKDNYNLTTTSYAGKGSITARDITATVADLDAKVYDGQTAVNNIAATLNNTVEGDTVSATASGSYADKNAGTDKAVTYNSFTLSGADKDNYNLTTTSYAGKGSITTAPITFKANDYTKTYDGNTDAPGATYSITQGQLFDGDQASGGTFAFTDANIGTGKTLTLSDITIADGNEGRNYAITYQNSTNSTIKFSDSGNSLQQFEEATHVTDPNVQSKAATAAPDAPADNSEAPKADSDGLLTLENNGVNAPDSMDTEAIAAQQQGENASTDKKRQKAENNE